MGRIASALLVWTCLAVCLLAVAAALAGEYHVGATLYCQECHVIHYSQKHRYDGTDFPGTAPYPEVPLGTGGPYEYLMRDDNSSLCLSCHDGQSFAPDVKGANTGTSYARQAGALTMGTPPYEHANGHTLEINATAPGGSSGHTLHCYSCHANHGNTNFRNLTGSGSAAVTYAKGTNNTGEDVFLRSWTEGQITTNYSVANVDFNEPRTGVPQSGSAMGQFCRGCHTDFHGRQGDSNMGGSTGTEWWRHPTADADIGDVGDSTHSSLDVFKNRSYRVQVMSPTGQWGTQGSAWSGATTDLTPSCMSCHKAHGNKNPFGLIYLEGTGPITEEGDTAGVAIGVRALCRQCHVQGN